MFLKIKTKLKSKPVFHPFYINGQCVIADVKLVDKRNFYDTTWQIFAKIVSCENIVKTEAIKIVGDDDEDLESLVRKIERCKTIDEITNLDRKDKIYYD